MRCGADAHSPSPSLARLGDWRVASPPFALSPLARKRTPKCQSPRPRLSSNSRRYRPIRWSHRPVHAGTPTLRPCRAVPSMDPSRHAAPSRPRIHAGTPRRRPFGLAVPSTNPRQHAAHSGSTFTVSLGCCRNVNSRNQWVAGCRCRSRSSCRHHSASVLIPAMRMVGNIVTGDDLQTQCTGLMKQMVVDLWSGAVYSLRVW
ncbi:uncharacterized protein LOC133890118 isoform X4 [Phragmites australis]|uniref:uncharacterized protein LOC133890118 isoform X4 n=1 Tax=Phragmites australis TaxID=29695 RepID=UPI002D7785CD|nr:uncharacterized protein LOC133890118 isoform X4 [Phragmites australis]